MKTSYVIIIILFISFVLGIIILSISNGFK